MNRMSELFGSMVFNDRVRKDWAIEKGVTHFTHWFQPMTGITAEKHDSFICTTFEARGYTSRAPISYAFIKESTLYIPTAFCFYADLLLSNPSSIYRLKEQAPTRSLFF